MSHHLATSDTKYHQTHYTIIIIVIFIIISILTVMIRTAEANTVL